MASIRPCLTLLALAALLAGCGGGGTRHGSHDRAGDFEGDYTGSYTLTSNTSGATDGAIVLSVGSDGETEGSLTLSGTVYDFTGRIVNDGRLSVRGDGLVVNGNLDRTDSGTTRTLSGSLTLSGSSGIQTATTTLTRVVATP